MASARTATLRGMNFVGISQHCGGYSRKKTDPLPVVPNWPQFIEGCVKYRQSLEQQQAARAPRTDEPYLE